MLVQCSLNGTRRAVWLSELGSAGVDFSTTSGSSVAYGNVVVCAGGAARGP